jgi:hypothetical protein
MLTLDKINTTSLIHIRIIIPTLNAMIANHIEQTYLYTQTNTHTHTHAHTTKCIVQEIMPVCNCTRNRFSSSPIYFQSDSIRKFKHTHTYTHAFTCTFHARCAFFSPPQANSTFPTHIHLLQYQPPYNDTAPQYWILQILHTFQQVCEILKQNYTANPYHHILI